MGDFLLKLKLIVWKNFIIRKRHKVLTIFEVAMPVLLFIILPIVQISIPEFHADYVNETTYYELDEIDMYNKLNVFYAPNISEVNDIMLRTKGNIRSEFYEGFPTEAAMLNTIAKLKENDTTDWSIIGVVFDNFPKDPKRLKYRIRSTNYDGKMIESAFPTIPIYYQSNWGSNYIHTGFVSLQKKIDFAFIDQVTNNKLAQNNIELTLQQMPTPPHNIENPMTIIYNYFLPMFAVLSFTLVFPSVLKRLIEEKCSGIKELMKMMGLEAWMLWLGWFIHSMVTNLVSVCFITILLKISFSESAHPIFENGNGGIIWFFMLLYCISGVCFAFAISTFFNRPTLGMYVGMVLWSFTFFATLPIADYPEKLSQDAVNLLLLLPNTCLIFGMRSINEFEKEGGLNFSNLWTKPNKYTPAPSMGQILLMLFVDSILFLIITWYVDNVFPGSYGTARKWYFPFTKSYWCSNKVEDDTLQDGLENRPEIEPMTNDLHAGIQVRNLRKKFKNKYAVDGLNLDVYSKQITILLGHNGAGKTTTMNIITGMLSATSGTAIVDGHDIKTNMNQVRESLGLCPQNNLQFPDLTVMEHLIFFAMLKGRSSSEAKLESLEFLDRLNLKSKADKMASSLSGGMRRKLSLGMALVGKTKVLMLDEPTSGMDPEARREIWDFLLGMRGERTILITTHYMEEADILGDRIAIMHHGQLMCYGTSLFLKKHYGTGYTLSILTSQNWDVNTITEAIKTYVPSAVVKSFSTGTIVYSLPTNETTSLSNLFTTLETNKAELGIANFGVSITSLEDVFLKVGELADEVDNTFSKNSDEGSGKYLLADNYLGDSAEIKNAVYTLNLLQQSATLIIKRVKYSMHKSIFFLLQAMVPIIMGLILFGIMKTNSNSGSENIKVDFSLRMYPQAQSFYSFDSANKDLADWYYKYVQDQNGRASVSDDVNNDILKVAKIDELRYHRTLVTAAQLNNSAGQMHLNALYGSFPLHGPPLSLNLITNALLKWLTTDDAYSISVSNNPLPNDYNRAESINMGIVMLWVFQIPIAYTLMMSFFLAFPQGEKLSGVKHLQIMSGVPRILYWFTNFLFDFIVYFIVTVLVIIILVAFDNGGIFGNGSAIEALSALVLLFGLAGLPFAYLFHYRPTPASSMTVFLWIQVLFGTIGALVMYLLSVSVDTKYKPIVQTFANILLFVPNFAISDGIQKFANKAAQIHNWNSMTDKEKEYRTMYGHPCSDPNSQACKDYLSFYHGEDSIAKNLIYLSFEFFIYSAIFLLIDTGLPGYWFDTFMDNVFYKNNKDSIDNNIDHDVAEERERVKIQLNESSRLNSAQEREQTIEDILLVSNLRKWFKKFYAVRGLNFGVKKGECFGLLGINGAGKTTTFKILTGDIFPTTGLANLQGVTLNGDKYNYLRNIGYCPQFDALNMQLTTREMLELFASIRGIKYNKIKHHVDRWIKKFDIKKYESIPCGKLSGGNKRKLSTAIALIGDPPLIMLDEPTSGVDPVARRNLWDILGVLRKSGQSIVLTSHSMDECEALCDRLGIMVDGQMKCLGNIQYLKNKYGQGFTVMVKLRTATSTGTDQVDGHGPLLKLKHTIENQYTCTLKDEHTGMILYHVTSPNVTLGELFSFMESLKTKEEMIEDYTVSDTSLEQVFLSFAKDKDRILSANPSNAIV